MCISCYLLVLVLRVAAAGVISVDKSDGGYENIVVAIDSSVVPDEDIITNVKALFQSSSDFLHSATEGRVYFKKVTIAIPETWPDRANVHWTSANLYDSSHIRIAQPNPPYNNTPYTLQPRGCGEPGEYIHLTPDFLVHLTTTTRHQFGDPAYHLVHEWAHFRYGVFDEYGTPGDESYPALYCEGKRVVANSCSRAGFMLVPDIPGDCEVHPGCRLPSTCVPHFPMDSREASIMFMPNLGTVSKFCDHSDARKHNPAAPNKHNEVCNKRPTWEVISLNPDFVGLPLPVMNKKTAVEFREVQKRKGDRGRVVLVLDVSGSMAFKSRMDRLKNAAVFYIKHFVHEGVQLGIVTFSTYAKILKPAVEVNSSTRIGLANAVDGLVAVGATAIGKGLEEGLKALQKDGYPAEGGTIIVMTDGEENVPPYMLEMLPKLKKEYVRVHTVALGGEADEKLEQLAAATEGKTYYFKDLQNDTDVFMEVAFNEATQGDVPPAERSVDIAQISSTLLGEKRMNFKMDKSLGTNTTVVIASGSAYALTVIVTDPTGNECTTCARTQERDRIIITLPTPAEEGEWTVAVRTTNGNRSVVNMLVSSKPKNPSEPPIRLRVLMNRLSVNGPLEAKVYAELVKGGNAVTGANVTAVVRRPHGDDVFIQLYDNGTGADNIAHDGIYSAFFTQFSGKGRYSVVIVAQDGGNATVMRGHAVSSGARPIYRQDARYLGKPVESLEIGKDIKYNSEEYEPTTVSLVSGTPAGQFERVSPAASFQTTRNFTTAEMPPGTITDLTASKVKRTLDQRYRVVLSWTCTGAHMDSGLASHVEIRGSLDQTGLVQNFETAVRIAQEGFLFGDIPALSVGSHQRLQVDITRFLPDPSSSSHLPDVYFAARVWNHEKVSSSVSNIATAYTSQYQNEGITIQIPRDGGPYYP